VRSLGQGFLARAGQRYRTILTRAVVADQQYIHIESRCALCGDTRRDAAFRARRDERDVDVLDLMFPGTS